MWQIDFQKKGDFHQKIWALLRVGDFLPKKRKRLLQTGSFPSAGKSLVVASHTSPTSSICIVQN
jgi:hypothetical protein